MIRKFRIDFKECDSSPKHILNEWLDTLHTVYRYAKNDNLTAFSEYLLRIYEEVSGFYPVYVVGNSFLKTYEFLSTKAVVNIIEDMRATLTSNERVEAKQWLHDLAGSDFFKILEKLEVKFKKTYILKKGNFYGEDEKVYLIKMLELIKVAIEKIINNI